MNIGKRFSFPFHCWLFLEMPYVTPSLGLVMRKHTLKGLLCTAISSKRKTGSGVSVPAIGMVIGRRIGAMTIIELEC